MTELLILAAVLIGLPFVVWLGTTDFGPAPRPGRGRSFPTRCIDCGRTVYCKGWKGELLYDEQHADGSWGRHWCF